MLEKLETKPMNLLMAERFLFPAETTHSADLFLAFQAAGNCDAALQIIDPNNQRKTEYSSNQSAYSGRGEYDDEEYSDSGGTQPLEQLGLTEDQIVAYALKAADCSKQTEDPHGQLFFLKLAS